MATKKEDTKTATSVLKKRTSPEDGVATKSTSALKKRAMPDASAAVKDNPTLKKRTAPDENKESSVLKKRTAPTEEKATSILNKRVAPDENKESSVLKKRTAPSEDKSASILKKRVTPDEGKESSVLKKRVSPVDDITSSSSVLAKKKIENDDSEKVSSGKSSLDKMRERIAAQKKLEQNMMTQQVLRNQEKDGLRSKLNKLNKELAEEEVIDTPKQNINFDLKSEALETQNKKLKQDAEKLKNQLQALMTLEFMDLKVLDPNNLTLSNEFVEAINSIKTQVESQKDKEEQSLKDELQSLQLELDNLRAKNEEAKKASVVIKRVAAQTQKALDEAKKAIEEQESNEVRNFKEEIHNLETQLFNKEQELKSLQQEKSTIVKDNEKAIALLKKSLEKEIENLNNKIKLQDDDITLKNDLNVKLQNETSKFEEQISLLEQKVKELEEKGNKDLVIIQEKEQLEKRLEEQAAKIDSLLLEYQKQLDAKDKEIDELRNTIVTKENALANSISKDELLAKETEISSLKEQLDNSISKDELLAKETEISSLKEQLDNSISKDELLTKETEISSLKEQLDNSISKEELNNKNDEIESLKQEIKDLNKQISSGVNEENSVLVKDLQDKCDQYQNLLLSERNSHLQVEQKLCNDLDNYKNEINELQSKITSMSSDYSLNRLHNQIEAIESYINDLKNNSHNAITNNAYTEYYDKLIVAYRNQEEKTLTEIKRRNNILKLLRDEKIKVAEVLKQNGKNISSFEKQIDEINAVINSNIEELQLDNLQDVEQQIIASIKDELMQYCDNIKNEATKELERINQKYDSSKSVSDLINNYNNDYEHMIKAYGNEVSKLNLERSINKSQNVENVIEEKLLMVEKQYRITTLERDKKFNEVMDRIRKQNFEIVSEEINNPYISVVGKEYIRSLNQYATIKKNILDKLEFVKTQYNNNIENIKNEENDINKFNDNIKESIAILNNQTDLTEEDVNKKNELMSQLSINEEKINHLYQYGYNVLKDEMEKSVKKLEHEYALIIDEENHLRELYEKREQEAKKRLELEKAKEDQSAQENAIKQLNEYRYIEEEAERIIESIQEKRERIHEQKVLTIEPKEVVFEKTEVKNVINKDINSVDYDSINQLQSDIYSLTFKLGELNSQEEETLKTIERYKTYQKQSTSHHEIVKYMECVKQYYALSETIKTKKAELEKIDEKTDKKAFKVKRAEYKSLDNKIVYYAKQIKYLNKKPVVSEYVKVATIVKELEEKVNNINNEKDSINIEINKKQLQIQSLKNK